MQMKTRPWNAQTPLHRGGQIRLSRFGALLALLLPVLAPAGCSCLIDPANVDSGVAEPDDGGPTAEPEPDDGGPNPEPQPDDGGPAPEPQPDDGGPNPEPQPDDGGPAPEPQPDDGGPNDGGPGPEPEPGDGGPNNEPPAISSAPDDVQLAVGGSADLVITAEDPDNDPLTYTMEFVDAAPDGVTISPASNDSGTFTLSASDAAAAGSFDVVVTVSDGNGGEATYTFTVTVVVGNVPPIVSAGPGASILPGELAALAGTVSDSNPGDTVTIEWTVQGGAPAGVTIADAGSAATTLSVDRSLYARPNGTSANALTLTLTATDSAGASSSATMTVTIEDERGRYMDATSPYSGTGPNGECGHPRHPCNNLQDALVNLAGADADGAAAVQIGPTVHVAETDTPIALDETVTSSSGFGVECGFDPTNLDADGRWLREVDARSSFVFTSLVGLQITGIRPNADAVVVSRCSFLGTGVNIEESVAIDATVSLELDDVSAIGSAEGRQPALARSIGLRLTDTGRPTFITGGVFEGGFAQTKAAGISANEAAVNLVNTNLLGGSAATAVAIEILSPPQQSTLVDVVAVGGQGQAEQGSVALAAGDSELTVTRGDYLGCESVDPDTINNVDGCSAVILNESTAVLSEVLMTGNASPTFPVSATFGLLANGSTVTTNNCIMAGGPAPANTADSLAVGVAVRTSTWLSTNDQLLGGSFAELAAGASIAEASAATFTGTDATGTDGTPFPIGATAVSVGANSTFEAEGGELRGGNASETSTGVITSERGQLPGADLLSLDGVDVVAGNARQSFGILAASGEVVLSNGTDVLAGTSETASYGVFVSCNIGLQPCTPGQGDPVSIDDVVASAGSASANGGVSAGIALFNVPRGISISNTEAYGEDATSPGARSYGIAVEANTSDLVIDATQAFSGEGALESTGININGITNGSCESCSITNSHAEGDAATYDSGLSFGGVASRANVTNNSIVAESVFGTPNFAVALSLNSGCDGCTIGQNVIVAHTGSASTNGVSYIERANQNAIQGTTVFYSNVVAAGSAPTTIGLRINGDSGPQLRVLNNTVDSGDATLSATAIRLGFFSEGPVAVREAALFGGNQLTLGDSPDTVGFHETCRDGGLGDGATRVELATDNNFHSRATAADNVVFVRRTDFTILGDCFTEDLTDIDDVNEEVAGNRYRAYNGSGCNAENTDDDPEFEVSTDATDGHISADSPLRGASPSTFGCGNAIPNAPFWNRNTAVMLDIDGETRPLGGPRADIGADEID